MCSPDIPDTSDATLSSIESQERIANKSFDQQDKMFDYFTNRQDKVDATADEVTRRELALAEKTAAQGDDLYNYQKEVYRPVEESLAAQAMQESTPEYYEKYAQEAVTAQANANSNAAAQAARAMQSMGVNPNSGAYASQQRGLQLANAAALGSVANDSRDKAEALSWARRADVAGIGKGLVGAGNASYGLATGANNSAIAATNQANGQAASTLGTPTQYAQLGLTAANNATNAYTDIYKTQTAAASQDSGLAGAAGMGLGGLLSNTAFISAL